MRYIGYSYKAASGKIIHKLVQCENDDEYNKMKQVIEKTGGTELIEFIEIYDSKRIPLTR